LFDTNKKVTDTHKLKLAFEAECRSYDIQDRKESEENYNFTMTLHKGKATGDLGNLRYDRDLKLVQALETKKTEERDKVVLERDTVEKTYMGMAEL